MRRGKHLAKCLHVKYLGKIAHLMMLSKGTYGKARFFNTSS
jgi:hypothetical protein